MRARAASARRNCGCRAIGPGRRSATLSGAAKSAELELLRVATRRLMAVAPAFRLSTQLQGAAGHFAERGRIVTNDLQAAATLGTIGRTALETRSAYAARSFGCVRKCRTARSWQTSVVSDGSHVATSATTHRTAAASAPSLALAVASAFSARSRTVTAKNPSFKSASTNRDAPPPTRARRPIPIVEP
jgi:hypothetical protein